MKSSSGYYYIGLDHVRAIAAFLVFAWHFIHVNGGQFTPPPVFPLSLVTEGHTGVALFMTLSGYLFAKILNGKRINYVLFIYNRSLRLIPLFLLVIIAARCEQYLLGEGIDSYVIGIVTDHLPNGGWSIATEFRYYLLLPGLLWLSRKSKYSLMFVLLAAVLIRAILYQQRGEMQLLSYWTIVGRIDQFLLGAICYQFRGLIAKRHILASSIFVSFAVFYWYFDSLGGFYKNPSYPSPSAIWVFMPTVEGLAYALIIAWYDNSFTHSTSLLSRSIALIGTYSYSIYLLHFFVVLRIATVINNHLVELSNIYVAMLFSVLSFLLMVPVGHLSYKYIESPFLKLRSRYIIDEESIDLGASSSCFVVQQAIKTK